jgi:hypothetical protein
VLCAGQAFGEFEFPISDPFPLSPDGVKGEEPSLATDGTGVWIVVSHSIEQFTFNIGTDPDILVMRSLDGGLTWSDPVPLNDYAFDDIEDDLSPKLSTDGLGTWLVVWESRWRMNDTLGPDNDFLFSRSTDNGANWSDAQPLTTSFQGDTGEDRDIELATDGAGHWVAVWESEDDLGGTIGTDVDVLMSRSDDNGQTWTSPVAIHPTAASDAITDEDEDPAIATDRKGNWIVMWRSEDDLDGSVGFDSDIHVVQSIDNGATWTEPSAITTDAASDTEEDEFVDLATDRQGNWVAAWHRRSVAANSTELVVSRSSGDTFLWPSPSVVRDSSDFDGPPKIATDRAGNWVIYFDSTDELDGTIGPDPDILALVSDDLGVIWTPASPLNTTADSEFGVVTDVNPSLTADQMGNWLLVWQSDALVPERTVGVHIEAATFNLAPDCNDNGADDELDIANQTSEDCDSDGVPDECEDDPDCDLDGIPNSRDNCPETANTDQSDVDGDGFGDECDGCETDADKAEPGMCGCLKVEADSDGDGVCDEDDECPSDFEKIIPGICGCGTPDQDSDEDGTPDCIDDCSDDPSKTVPGGCGCGVADTDTDSDGTPNCNDGCPDDPDKTAPGTCGCGVSDVDTDGDAVFDCEDGCPDNPDVSDPGESGCESTEAPDGPDSDPLTDVTGDQIDNPMTGGCAPCDLLGLGTPIALMIGLIRTAYVSRIRGRRPRKPSGRLLIDPDGRR